MMEARAKWLFHAWGEFRRHTTCEECGELRYCHAARRRGRWLCLTCFDLSPEAERFIDRRKV